MSADTFKSASALDGCPTARRLQPGQNVPPGYPFSGGATPAATPMPTAIYDALADYKHESEHVLTFMREYGEVRERLQAAQERRDELKEKLDLEIARYANGK